MSKEPKNIRKAKEERNWKGLRNWKRLVVISDLHCGHPKGLVPPAWQVHAAQEEFWKWYTSSMQVLQPVDIVLVNGDAIDGNGRINSGIELITTNRLEQVAMAAECVDVVQAKSHVFTTGSPYHVGKAEDFEEVLARQFSGHFEDRVLLDVNGLRIDARHHHSRSVIPHGRNTALARSAMWNVLIAAMQEDTSPSVLIRSHVHYHTYFGDPVLGLGMTTPCLQWDSRYGSKICEGVITVGFVYFDIFEDGSYTWSAVKADPKLKRRSVVSL